jgi:rfaE bifunctional protein nucleotidyltransferase chain/domain
MDQIQNPMKMLTSNLKDFIRVSKRNKKKVGFITGCFDILHKGHLSLFSFAKKHCDILVVGVENDKNIKRSKGQNRPINSQKVRMKNLSKIKEIDYVFPINIVVSFGDKNVAEKYLPLVKEINPDYLITNIITDKYWREKEKVISGLPIRLLKHKERIPISTTEIINKRGY